MLINRKSEFSNTPPCIQLVSPARCSPEPGFPVFPSKINSCPPAPPPHLLGTKGSGGDVVAFLLQQQRVCQVHDEELDDVPVVPVTVLNYTSRGINQQHDVHRTHCKTRNKW